MAPKVEDEPLETPPSCSYVGRARSRFTGGSVRSFIGTSLIPP